MALGDQTLKLVGEKAVEDLRKELDDQGHTLTGALDKSITADVEGDGLDILAEGYMKYVNDGFPAKSASMKQFPFVVKYWQQRALGEEEAKRAAAATIHKWMKEGMPTGTSMAHSRNERRTKAIREALENNNQIDTYIEVGLDSELDDIWEMDKTEII